VPGAASAHNASLKRRFTIAQNTAGALVSVYTAGNDTGTPLATTAANVAPSTSPGSTCTASDAYGNRSCTFDISAPVGTDDFAITTWDQAPSGASIPVSANELGWGLDPSVAIVAGATAGVSVTLSSVLASVSLDLTPATLHQIIPSTGTIGVYALDADNDVIVSNGFVDPNGNPITISLNYDNSLNGALYLSTSSISAPSATGVQYNYAPNGMLNASSNATVNFSASSSYAPVTSTGAALQALYPTFTSISDSNLNVNNPYHGGIVFDGAGGAYYSTPSNFGGLSYYSGSGTSVTNNYPAVGSAPIRGGIAANGTSTFYAMQGTQAYTFGAPPASTIAPVPNTSPAPLPNGSALAYDPPNSKLWYTSGSNLAFIPVSGGIPQSVGIGVNTTGGVTTDASDNVWVVDNVNNRIIEYPGGNNPLQGGGSAFDILSNTNSSSTNSLWITDHGPNPAILQVNTSGNLVSVNSLPYGAAPWYLMADNAQPGIIWFDYLYYGQIGIGRMDTNVSPATFVMATDPGGATNGTQVGAIGAASNGLVYMVFDGTSTLVQVQR
jgi:hypothetical protein